MPKIPFADARFPDALPDIHAVERRLTDTLAALRRGGQARDGDGGGGGTADGAAQRDAAAAGDWDEWPPPASQDPLAEARSRRALVTDADRARIARRARRHVDRVTAATGTAHLTREQRERLAVLRGGADLVAIPSEHRADEIAAALHADMPWMAPATEAVWHAMRTSVRDGDAGLRLPPMLLVGSPGIGKSHWARALGNHLGVPTTIVDATGEPAAWSVIGLQKGWGSQGPGRVLETILSTLVANALVIIDEIEKAGDPRSDRGLSYSLAHALLPLLERSTASSWSCPNFRVRFDMSWVGWVLTANTTDGLPAPLLSRVPPLVLADLSGEQLIGFARREAARRALPEEVADDIAAILGRLSDRDRPSLRTIVRMVERADPVRLANAQLFHDARAPDPDLNAAVMADLRAMDRITTIGSFLVRSGRGGAGYFSVIRLIRGGVLSVRADVRIGYDTAIALMGE